MQSDSSFIRQSQSQNEEKPQEKNKVDPKKEKNEIFEEISQQKIIQNNNLTFQTINSLNPKSSQMVKVQKEKKTTKPERSIFHNFQKHLVQTLRKNIKIKKSSSKNQPSSAAWQIWQNFTNKSKISTKNILHILFGVVDYEGYDLTNIYEAGIVEKFGFAQIFSRYSDKLIISAQELLRFQVIRQIKQMDLREIMRKRRLVNVEAFIKYVKEFVGELEEGPMRKRLPKNKKIQMKFEKVSKQQ